MKNVRAVYKLTVLFLFMFPPLAGSQPVSGTSKLHLRKELPEKVHTVELNINYARIFVEQAPSRTVELRIMPELKAPAQTVQKIMENFVLEHRMHDNVLEIDARFKNDEIFGGRSQKRNISLMVQLRVPEGTNLRINGNFLRLHVPELDGNLDYHGNYGRLEGGYLKGAENRMDGNYFDCRVKYARGMDLRLNYSDIITDVSFRTLLQGNNSKLQVKRVKNLYVSGNFLQIKSDRIYRLKGQGNYFDLHVKRIYIFKFSGNFNTYLVEELPRNFHLIELRGTYDETEIHNPLRTPYRFKIILKAGTLESTDLVFTKKKIKTFSAEYEGYFADPNAQARILIDQSFSTVTIQN